MFSVYMRYDSVCRMSTDGNQGKVAPLHKEITYRVIYWYLIAPKF